MSNTRRPLPLSIRILGLVVLPILAALACGFWILNSSLTDGVKSAAKQNVVELQRSHSQLWAESDTIQQASVASVAENTALKAGLRLLGETSDRALASATVADQLAESHSALPYELVAVLDSARVPLAARMLDAAGKDTAADLGSAPMNLHGILRIGGKLYRSIVVPINMGDENLGYLVTGRIFSAAVPYGFALLLHEGKRVWASADLAAAFGDDAIRQLAQCEGSTSCEVRAGSDTWVASQVRTSGIDGGHRLWVVQSMSATMARMTAGMRTAFLFITAGVLLAAGLLAWFASHGVTRPLTNFVTHLRASEHTGVLRGDFPADSSTKEVNELASAFNTAAHAVADSQRRLDEAYLQFTKTLAQALDARDHYTAGHSNRVSQYAVQLAKALNLSVREQEVVELGATLHDIGKIGIPDQVLQKPGKLTDDEFRQIQQHPTLGKRILEGVARFHDYLSIVELHHENHDGTGYPWGLKGENIPISARIVHVVDAFDAMTSNRPYRQAMAPERALGILEECAGTQFDPAVVYAFLQLARTAPQLVLPNSTDLANLEKAVRDIPVNAGQRRLAAEVTE